MGTDIQHNRRETVVGVLVIAGILIFCFAAFQWISRNLLDATGYILYADFVSASGLHSGDPVEIAGVQVGAVDSITLNDYQARLALRIKDTVTIYEDASATINTDWLIGNGRISIDPGASGEILRPGEEIKNADSPPTIQDMVGQLVAGNLLSRK